MKDFDPMKNIKDMLWQNQQNKMRIINKTQEENKIYKEKVLKHLEQIATNTENLQDMFILMWANNEKQDEIFQLLVEILEISKARNEREAESKYRQVMNKINNFSGDIESVQKIKKYGELAYKTVMALIKGEPL